jgi:tetratricopeptide (TPR) repeat protein
MVPNNGRFQSDIEEQQKAAEQLLKEVKDITGAEWLDLALIAVEGGKWADVLQYAAKAEQMLGSSPSEEKGGEATAIIQYVRATAQRESNNLKEAQEEYLQILNSRVEISPWLRSNVLRNFALVYVKQGNWAEASRLFEQAYGVANEAVATGKDPALEGSLPPLYNYCALATTRWALQRKTPNWKTTLELGLQKFKQATLMYQAFFTTKGIMDPEKQRLSNDLLSHYTHRGMISCELAETPVAEYKDLDRPALFAVAQKTLLDAYVGRKAIYRGVDTNSNAQRLGDSAQWVGRAYQGLKDTNNAKLYFSEAFVHFKKAYPPASQTTKTKDFLDQYLIADATQALLDVLQEYSSSKLPKSGDRVANLNLLRATLADQNVVKTEAVLLGYIRSARRATQQADETAKQHWWRVFKPRNLMGSRFQSALDKGEVAVRRAFDPSR